MEIYIETVEIPYTRGSLVRASRKSKLVRESQLFSRKSVRR